MTIERILVGLDSDGLAASATITAVHLGRALDVPVEIVHVIDTKGDRPWFADDATVKRVREDAIRDARANRAAALEKWLQPLATTPAEIASMLRIEIGRPATILRQKAAEGKPAILVLGGHRQRGVLDLGGTARELMSQPPCPMWIQGDRSPLETQRMLVPIDMSEGSHRVAEMAQQLAGAFKASLTPFYCYEAPVFAFGAAAADESGFMENLSKREKREFQEFAERTFGADTAAQLRFVEGDPGDTILAADSEFDLLVMGTHGHSALGRAFLGSHTYHVLKATTQPVVIVPVS